MSLTAYRRLSIPLRAALLMPLAALTVHQLRYHLVFGGHTASWLRREGHGYLATIEPFILLAAALAVGAWAGQLARALNSRTREGGTTRTRGLLRTWLVCALALLALYCVQELAEGMFASGHPGGLAALIGHLGLIAIPIALLVGGFLALALSGAEALIGLASRRRTRPRRAEPRRGRQTTPLNARDWRLDPRSGVVAGRAPPPAPALV